MDRRYEGKKGLMFVKKLKVPVVECGDARITRKPPNLVTKDGSFSSP